MEIQLNGKPYVLKDREMSVLDLFDDLGLDTKGRVLELNQQILGRESYKSTRFSEGDSVEIIQFMGGGC